MNRGRGEKDIEYLFYISQLFIDLQGVLALT